ncbi:copper-binding protein [Streptomyces sp. ISL-36]|uniref:copper-binding protein n=1 Tax=Streptomyces sp. ISL-36 TaxID=2819182 RepID=UPI001BED1A13|nr:copper-binding protein [Streptomyces sp. ISL-36]MBT2440526.1 copper-binding protein [Streptomyces sp. ISL-36]
MKPGRRSRHRYPLARTLAAASLLALALAMAGCGDNNGNGTTTVTTPATTAPTQRAAQTVDVDETDFALKLSETAFAPGTYTFNARNSGRTSHALAISGPGLTPTQTGGLAPGETEKITVTLREGEYELWCPVGNHRAMGMTTRIRVGAGTPPARTPDGGYPAPAP